MKLWQLYMLLFCIGLAFFCGCDDSNHREVAVPEEAVLAGHLGATLRQAHELQIAACLAKNNGDLMEIGTIHIEADSFSITLPQQLSQDVLRLYDAENAVFYSPLSQILFYFDQNYSGAWEEEQDQLLWLGNTVNFFPEVRYQYLNESNSLAGWVYYCADSSAYVAGFSGFVFHDDVEINDVQAPELELVTFSSATKIQCIFSESIWIDRCELSDIRVEGIEQLAFSRGVRKNVLEIVLPPNDLESYLLNIINVEDLLGNTQAYTREVISDYQIYNYELLKAELAIKEHRTPERQEASYLLRLDTNESGAFFGEIHVGDDTYYTPLPLTDENVLQLEHALPCFNSSQILTLELRHMNQSVRRADLPPLIPTLNLVAPTENSFNQSGLLFNWTGKTHTAITLYCKDLTSGLFFWKVLIDDDGEYIVPSELMQQFVAGHSYEFTFERMSAAGLPSLSPYSQYQECFTFSKELLFQP